MSNPSARPKLPFPSDLIQSLGALTLTYSALDLQLKLLVWKLISPEIQSVGKIVTASIPMAPLLDLLSSLLQLRTNDQALVDRMNSLVKNVDTLSRERNQIIHAIWVARPSGDTALRGRITARRAGFTEKVSLVRADDVYDLATRLQDATHQIVELEHSIVASSPALTPR